MKNENVANVEMLPVPMLPMFNWNWPLVTFSHFHIKQRLPLRSDDVPVVDPVKGLKNWRIECVHVARYLADPCTGRMDSPQRRKLRFVSE